MPKILTKKVSSPVSPWQVFQRLSQDSKTAFFLDSSAYLPPDQRYSFLGADPFLEISLSGGKVRLSGEETGVYPASDIFKILRKLFLKYKTSKNAALPFFSGGAVGYLNYEFLESLENIRLRKKPGVNIPVLYFAFYRDLIVYDYRAKRYILIASSKDHLNRLQGFVKPNPLPRTGGEREKFALKKFRPEMKRGEFCRMVERVKEYIRAGDIYQANLSQRFSFEFTGQPEHLYEKLRQINPSPFSSFLKTRDFTIVSSSPERLILKKGRRCETRPIAGTRPRRKGEEKKLSKELLANPKERAEHIMLVDLERNDLGRVCDYRSVKVDEFMKIEKYSHVIHIVSKITGKLSAGKDAFDLIKAVFPGGTITGCPKVRCMQIIDELEPVKRGIYTGSLGYLDFNGDMDLNIVIRTLILQKNKGYLQTGAGIVYDSDPELEYEETLHKGEALVEALVKASH